MNSEIIKEAVRLIGLGIHFLRNRGRIESHMLRWELQEIRTRLSKSEAERGNLQRRLAMLERMVGPAMLALQAIVAGSDDPYEDAVKGLAALAEIEAQSEAREVN